MGGSGGPGTNPEQLFATGYAACFQSALLRRAGNRPAKGQRIVADRYGTVDVVIDRSSLQSRISSRSAKYQRPSILANVSR